MIALDNLAIKPGLAPIISKPKRPTIKNHNIDLLSTSINDLIGMSQFLLEESRQLEDRFLGQVVEEGHPRPDSLVHLF